MCKLTEHSNILVFFNWDCYEWSTCRPKCYNLDEMNDCEILKGKRPYTGMYLENGWYDYAKSKNYKVGYVLIFHYQSDLEMLYVKLVEK